MGWFSRKKKPTIIRINGNGNYSTNIVGESHYQSELNKITGGKTEDSHRFKTEAMLILENTNPHDNKAVAVLIEGRVVGYLPRKKARKHRKTIEVKGFPGATTIVDAVIVGGWRRDSGDEGHYGVRLDMPL